MTEKIYYCQAHGCLNRAKQFSFHSVMTSEDGKSRWDVFVNSCDEHFHSLVGKNQQPID